jgi:hypothetical protein
VLSDNPVILLVNIPIPVPSNVLLSAIVGLVAVLQHTPRTLTVAPPSEVILPPLVAVVPVMAVAAVVVIVAALAEDVNEISVP